MAYSIFDPKVDRPLHEMSRKESQTAYDWFIENIPERLDELCELLHEGGIDLDFSESSLIKLHDYFFDFAQEERAVGNSSPSPELFSLCNDIGIYIAEILRKEEGRIDWDFYISNQKGLSYQRPVLVGFDVKNKDYHIDVDYLICQYVFRILKTGKKENDLFLAILKKAKTIV